MFYATGAGGAISSVYWLDETGKPLENMPCKDVDSSACTVSFSDQTHKQ